MYFMAVYSLHNEEEIGLYILHINSRDSVKLQAVRNQSTEAQKREQLKTYPVLHRSRHITRKREMCRDEEDVLNTEKLVDQGNIFEENYFKFCEVFKR